MREPRRLEQHALRRGGALALPQAQARHCQETAPGTGVTAERPLLIYALSLGSSQHTAAAVPDGAGTRLLSLLVGPTLHVAATAIAAGRARR